MGKLKTNWDAALDLKYKCMGVGIIVRDSDGAVVAALCSTIPYIFDPTLAEGVSLWRVVLLCLDLEIPRLILEGDSHEIVQALLQGGLCWSRYGYLIEEARHKLNGLQELSVTHTQREANKVAHRLAKAALN